MDHLRSGIEPAVFQQRGERWFTQQFSNDGGDEDDDTEEESEIYENLKHEKETKPKFDDISGAHFQYRELLKKLNSIT